jgi:hypothetical protein
MNSTNSKNMFFMITFIILLVFVYSIAFFSGIGSEIVMNLP